MIRNVTALTLALLSVGQASAQFTWNGPFTGTTNWSAGTWAPGTPPMGGGSGTTLTFTQIGTGAYTAANDLGNPFVLTTLNLAGDGGGITVSSLASNTLEFVGTAGVNQNGIGNAVVSSSGTLTATNTTFGGTGFGNVRFSGILDGAGGITINKPQTLFYTGMIDIAGANTFGGGVTLQAGNLRIGNAAALGTGTLTVNGGTVGASATSTIANNITLNSDLVYSGFANLTTTGVISESGGARNVVLSTMTGSTLIFQGANTYTGTTTAIVSPLFSTNGPVIGSLTMSGANGSAALSSGFTFNGGGTLTLDNSAAGANNDNRIGNSAPVAISGGTFVLNGANGGATLEDIGVFSGNGSTFVTINAGTAGNTGTTLQADTLVRQNRGQFNFRGNNASFGAPLAANVANLVFDTAPTLTGGGGAAGTTTISILPYATGGITTGSVGTDLVTYGANGIRPLSTTANEYATTITSGSTTADNVRLSAVDAAAVTAPTQINALVIATTTPFTGSTSTLTVNSGTVLNASAAPIPAAMTLAFGASEGVLFNNAVLTVDGVLTGTNGLTKTGTSNLVLTNPANNVTGTLTLNQGAISFPDAAVIASFNDIVVNGRSSGTSSPGLLFSPTTGTATVNKPMTVTDGFVRLQSGTGATLTYSGQISGPGGVLVNGGDVELTNTSNNYTGQTRVFLGNVVISGDNVLGNGGGVDIGSSTTTGLRLTGDWTTSRQVNVSFSAQFDTNGFNMTLNSPLTGFGATLNKVGAGVWTLTQGGALGQSQTSGTTGTTTTFNVAAGELRATNPSGSATGTATINVNNDAVISGTGRFGGLTTVAATAFVAPGTGGATIGTLGFGSNVTVNGTYTANVAGTMADQVNIAGALTLGAASVLDFPLANSYDPGFTYTLMQFASVTGMFATTPGLPASHFLVYNPTSLQLVPVPEPTAILAVAGIGLMAGYRIRRRRRLRS
jgi:autotransporter-associated beta strand protein